ncbi:MAG: bifunctional folylpolyglutamate synthase/dihydrofolate synthase [Oscillospiraceae bacterium]|nr:bifunctional folylpolyglutamate synthase/dihydrofolate synthase [Oscillospiraceae bacterium]
MTYEQALAYIHSVNWQGKTPGLHRIRALLEALGNPQKQLRFVHVAGTNGKGSTCACLASILSQAGYRVGLYTSPFIHRFNERFQVNGQPISDSDLCSVLEYIRPAAEELEQAPTEFELITALAMVYFVNEQCDLVVLEVGLGGALDPTNIIDTPELAIITALGLDHVRELGGSLAQIAQAKAGIIKSGGTVLFYGHCPEAEPVIAGQAERCHARLLRPRWDTLNIKEYRPEATIMDYADFADLQLPLLASYQPYNAAMAIEAALLLRAKGYFLSARDIREGIARVSWPGRFELLRQNPPFLLDGSHNPQGIRATAESLAARYPGRRFVVLLGLMADKDVSAMIGGIAPYAHSFVTVTPPSPRAMEAEALACRVRAETGLAAQSADSIPEGVALALAAGGDGVCALGSLYFSSEIRDAAMPLL